MASGGVVLGIVILLCTTACSASVHLGSPVPKLSNQCAAKPGGGALCIHVLKVNGGVGDVIGYLASTESPLKGKHWRLVLSSYGCDPGTGTTPACSPVDVYPTATRHGTPPVQTYCRRADGTLDRTSPGCHNTLAADYASFGDWGGFAVGSDGYRPAQETWLCVSEQINSESGWTSPVTGSAPTPVRACSAVSPA